MSTVTFPGALERMPDVATNLTASSSPRGRASWSGLLKLSLVAVPVKAYPATTSAHETHFNQLHAGCGQRIRQEKHCPLHGKLEAGAIVSGYPYAPDQYVIIDEAELESMRPVKDRALSLEHFLDAGHLDPAFYSGRSLYLLPDGPAAHHSYAVLTQAMQERHKWALGRVVLSSRRQLALVRPAGRLLTLHVLHYPMQVRSSVSLETELRPDVATEAESQLAGMLIDASSRAISWEDYRDDTSEKLAALIEAKVQGRPLVAPVADEVTVLHLLDALKQSVAQATKQRSTAVVPAGRRSKKKATRRSA